MFVVAGPTPLLLRPSLQGGPRNTDALCFFYGYPTRMLISIIIWMGPNVKRKIV